MFKKPEDFWVEKGLVFFISFYAQPFVFQLRETLFAPTLRRCKKLAKVSMVFQVILFGSFALLGYWIFGEDYTPELFIVRIQLYDAKHFFERI
jgi:hypothetical protein